MEYPNLLCERQEALLIVRLNRPEKLNSLSQGLLEDLKRCAADIGADRTVRAAILTGAGRGFCAGADLTDPEGVPGRGQRLGHWVAERLRKHFHPVAESWSRLPVPWVAAVNGVTAGAGVSLALFADVTIAARSASFSVLFTPRLGLVPDMGATHLLPGRIGLARARHLALTGRPVGGEEAERIGLVADCVDDSALAARALALAAQLAAGPVRAQLALRELMDDGASRSLQDQLEREAVAQQELADTADFLEGLTAFREKRSPRFSGD